MAVEAAEEAEDGEVKDTKASGSVRLEMSTDGAAGGGAGADCRGLLAATAGAGAGVTARGLFCGGGGLVSVVAAAGAVLCGEKK